MLWYRSGYRSVPQWSTIGAMARGWESKSVESQIDSFESREKVQSRLTAKQIECQRKKESLMLTRTRVLADIERSRHPRHRKMLEDSLAHIEGLIAGIDSSAP